MQNVQEALPGVRLVTAPNPSPLTLEGTNTWLVAGWVVDPGPLVPSHVDAVVGAAGSAASGIVLTHSHVDHSEAAAELASRLGGVGVVLPDGSAPVGPFSVIPTPGHSADSVCLLWERVLFTGDTVLGRGSVFIAPGEGSLSAYLRSLERLLELSLDAICPGHGPVVLDPGAKLREYRDHRLEREGRLVDALDGGARTADELLALAWSDVDLGSAPLLRVAAEATLAAHLQKLEAERRLPEGVEAAALAGPSFGES
jgi:glyoxylase-like metal-dependent hydrolase (beta-lactamase superfamily II)